MTHNFDKMTTLRIARYYYIDGLSQQEIALKENIHRSQVSRMLSFAKETGIVTVKVALPGMPALDAMERQLANHLGIKKTVIIPKVSAKEDDGEALYFFAARYLEEALKSMNSVGIGVGKTMYKVAAQLSVQQNIQPMEFYSVAGYSGSNNPFLQGSVILDNFARPFNGSCHYNNFAILANQNSMSPIDVQRLEHLRNSYQNLDAVVLSIGEPFNSEYTYFEEFSLAIKHTDMKKMLSKPHGNLLGHVFFQDGSWLRLKEPYVMTSMDLYNLKNTPEVICIAAGNKKRGPDNQCLS